MENETNQNKSYGGVIGAIVIIVILVAGGWYFIGNRMDKIEKQKQANKVLDVSTGTSTELSDIQKDLDNLDLDALNQ